MLLRSVIFLKAVGILILAICPIIFGISHSMTLKSTQNQIEKIIQLINWFITELNFNKSNLTTIIENCSSNEMFKNLNFLKKVKTNMHSLPFPNSWEKAVEEWECCLTTDDKKLLKSLSKILGAFDATSQISALKHAKAHFKESFKNAKTAYEQKSKLAKSLGILTGVAICIIFI